MPKTVTYYVVIGPTRDCDKLVDIQLSSS